MVERFQNGSAIPLLTATLVNSAGVAQTGLGNVTVSVRRDSDGFWLDWADSVFKAAGWTTIDGAMTEVDATRAAGVYRRNFPTTGYADDKYYFRMTSPSAFNVPQEAAAIVGDYVDNLDVASSTLATAASLTSGVATLTALLHGNAFVDNTVHGVDGTTSGRLRGFASAAAAAAATDGAADGAQGETSRWTITTTYDGLNQVRTHVLVRTL